MGQGVRWPWKSRCNGHREKGSNGNEEARQYRARVWSADGGGGPDLRARAEADRGAVDVHVDLVVVDHVDHAEGEEASPHQQVAQVDHADGAGAQADALQVDVEPRVSLSGALRRAPFFCLSTSKSGH